MNQARIASIVIAAVILLGGLTAFYFMGQRGGDGKLPPLREDPAAASTQSRQQQLELMTILGDVRFNPNEAGRFREARVPDVSEMTAAEREELSKLMTLPYLQGSTTATEAANVTLFDRDAAYKGLNVYISGHKPEAFVMDMDGKVLHKWQFEIRDVWPDVPQTIHSTFWRRAYAYPSGDLLAIFEGIGLIKLDRHSRLQWAFHGGAHHEARVADDGRIYVLSREAQVVARINPTDPVLADYVTILNAEGAILEQYSVFEAFEKSKFTNLLVDVKPTGDLFHTNSLYVFDGSQAEQSPFFKNGNVLISCLKIDVVAIIDLAKNEVVWAQSGRRPGATWMRQHDPTLLPNGHIMVFDNQGNDGRSKVLELDPTTQRIVWTYEGDDAEGLFSKTCGVSRRLPNGNTLVTESDNGRAIEISSNNKIVWEFYNPHRAGKDGELVATLFEVTRVDATYFSWLAGD